MKSILTLLLIVTIQILVAQDISVPDSIASEISNETFILKNGNDTITFKIRYPNGYSASMNLTKEGKKKKFPVVLALSGGNQSSKIVNYCYAAWFRSDLFENHIVIMPVSKEGDNLKSYSKKQIKTIYKLMLKLLPAEDKDWTIIGTSNGGIAAFNFVNYKPKLFKSVIVVPGLLPAEIELKKYWAKLDVVLAYGSLDNELWIKGAADAEIFLKDKVKNIYLIELEGQGHIIPIGYNLDQVYRIVCN